MTNAELIEKHEIAWERFVAAEKARVEADDAGKLTDEIELAYMEADHEVRQLSREIAARAFEPRPKAW